MKKACIILALFFITACAGLPGLLSVNGNEREAIMQKCLVPFAVKPRRFVHAISGNLPGGAMATMVGISVIYPDTGKLRCTLMSIEGFVFLDAEYDRKLVIKRGIGPFGSEDMVMGMVRDIRLVLFKPQGTMIDCGTIRNRSAVCRYGDGNAVVDVIMNEQGVYTIRSYDNKTLSRTATFSPLRHDGISGNITLVATGMFSYSLQMDLIESEPVL